MPITTSTLPALPHTADSRSISERFNAVLKNLYNKVLPVGAANTVLTSDGTSFSWVAPATPPITNTGATTFLGADVPVTVAGTFVNGPNTGSIGANGQTWLIMACLTYNAGTNVQAWARIHNGTSAIIDTDVNNASGFTTASLAIVVALSAATTFTLQATDNGGASTGAMKTTAGANGTANKGTSITAVRLA